MGHSLRGSYGWELLGIGRLVRHPHRRHRHLWKARAMGCPGCTIGLVARRVCCSHLYRLALIVRQQFTGGTMEPFICGWLAYY